MERTDHARSLGASGILVPPVGVGTNKWGAKDTRPEDVFQGFQAALDAGLRLFDTAEIYTNGNSERLLGEFTRSDRRSVILASKFAPWPSRVSPRRLINALEASLKRLGAETLDLCFIHFPFTFLSTRALMDVMAQAVRSGQIRAVGVSNYNAPQMRDAAECLSRHKIPLAANQVQYSLLPPPA